MTDDHRTDSYAPADMTGGIEGETARLEAQAALSFDKELFLLHALGIGDGISILEVGSGTGAVTTRLARAFPNSAITALEPDPALRAVAARRMADDTIPTDRIITVDGTCEETGLADDSIDLAFVRFVFQHLADPTAAGREVRRVLRPGGRIVVVDVDGELWGLSSPYNADLMPIHARVFAAQTNRGGNRYIGRHLSRILDSAGFSDTALHTFAVSSDEVGREPFAPIIGPENLLPHVESGLVSMSEYSRVLRDYQRFAEDPNHVVISLGFLATGLKP